MQRGLERASLPFLSRQLATNIGMRSLCPCAPIATGCRSPAPDAERSSPARRRASRASPSNPHPHRTPRSRTACAGLYDAGMRQHARTPSHRRLLRQQAPGRAAPKSPEATCFAAKRQDPGTAGSDELTRAAQAGLSPHAWPPMSAQHVQPRQHTPRARLRVPNQHGPLSHRRPTPSCVRTPLTRAANSRNHHTFARLQWCTSGSSAPRFAQLAAPRRPCPGMPLPSASLQSPP